MCVHVLGRIRGFSCCRADGERKRFKRNKQIKENDTEVEARRASAAFPPRRRCLGRRTTAGLFRRERGSRELLCPEMFQRRRNLDKGKAWRKVWPTQTLAELTINGAPTRPDLATSTTTGHFLMLTFMRFISRLPKLSERRGR